MAEIARRYINGTPASLKEMNQYRITHPVILGIVSQALLRERSRTKSQTAVPR